MPIEPISAVGSNASSAQLARITHELGARLQQSFSRVASGMRITSPAVDAAGLAQAIKLGAEIDRIGAAQSNLTNAVSFSETQQGSLQLVQQSLNRMGELSVRAQDITLSDSDRGNLQQEFSQLQNVISDTTGQKFNGVDLFSSQAHEVTADGNGGTTPLPATNLGASGAEGGVGDVVANISISTLENATVAMKTIDIATQNLANIRAIGGVSVERINVSNEGLSVLSINLNAAKGRIVDADLPRAASEFIGNQLLRDSALLAFTSANRFPRPGLSALA